MLATGRATCTYAQLAAHLDRVRAALHEWLPLDNRVIAVAAPNGPELLTAIVAAMSAGICAPFDPSRPAAEVDAFLADIQPSLVLADDATIERYVDIFNRRGAGTVRMIASPAAPAGVFDVIATKLRRGAHDRVATEEPGTVLLLRTSGTTASSKIVPHTEARLMHVYSADVEAVDMRPTDRCLTAMPLYHVHAISWVTGASFLAGGSVVFPTTIGAAALVDGLRIYQPTWYTASPATHRAVLAHLGRETRLLEHSLRFVRTTSAPIDLQLLTDLEAALGVPVLEGYGSTEAPSASLNPPPPLTRKLGSVGLPTGCEVAIIDGEVAIRGANVAPAYAGGERRPIIDPLTGWYRTGDAGHLDADGYLYITGRLDELINVGGDKVIPEKVEEALRAHPAVADAVAFPLPHPTLGQHVAVAVVPRADVAVTERQLIEYATLLLPRPAVPNVVHLVTTLARDGSGKARRHELTATFARDSRLTQLDPKSGQDDSRIEALVRIWEDVLEYAPVAIDENFFAAGGDSLRAVRVVARIEADLGVTMPVDIFLFAPTIRELAQAMRTHSNTTHRSRIVPLRSTGSRPPLFFYHTDLESGGLYARFLLTALDSEQPIYLVGPYGAPGDVVPESIEAMAAVDAMMITTDVPSQSYRLAGYCRGGVVAFEVARLLENAGATVDIVALIASSVPNALLEPLGALTSRASRFLSPRGTQRFHKVLRSIANAVRTRSYPAEIVNAVHDLWHPPPTPTATIQIYLDRLLFYFPKRTMRSVDLIWPDDDRPMLSGDPSMGWRHVAHVRRHSVGGNHTTVLTDHVGELGMVLRRIFDFADG
ncbi:MAG TPA: AMP-binding protein [Candidatus Lustribacter sp.]|nr:AMP-binding protein [Candidatus Lustribacter sp.]